MHTDEHKFRDPVRVGTWSNRRFVLSVLICVHLSLILFTSCSTKPTDPRTVIPGDALIYIETADLGKAIAAITEGEAFAKFSKKKPDLSSISGVPVSIAVTGFEREDQELTEEHGVIKFQPHFVAVAETNAWNWQAERFAENKLGELINDIFGGETELEVTKQPDGKHFVWKSQDGRKVFGLLQGSLLYFANDESSIEKCLAVKRGDAESIAANPKVAAGERLAFGYIPADGVAQLANIAGLSVGVAASEEGEVRNFVEGVLPQVIRGSVTEIAWTATKTDQGISDRFDVTFVPEVAKIASETIVTSGATTGPLEQFIPADFVSTTRYSIKDPRLAWRSVVLTAQSKTDQVSGGLIGGFSSSIFEPYAIEDPERFLSSVSNQILTVYTDTEGQDAVVIAEANDASAVKRSLAKEIDFAKPGERISDADVWKSADGASAAAFVGSIVVLGDADTVVKCLEAKRSGTAASIGSGAASNAVSYTVANEFDPSARLIEVLGERHDETTPLAERSYTSTTIDTLGLHRTTISDFGTIGAMIEQFVRD